MRAAPRPRGHRNNLAPDSMDKIGSSSAPGRCSGSCGTGLGYSRGGRRSDGGGGGGLGWFRARFTAAVGVLAVVAPLGALAQDPSGVSTGFEHSCVVTSTGSVKVRVCERARGRGKGAACLHGHRLGRGGARERWIYSCCTGWCVLVRNFYQGIYAVRGKLYVPGKLAPVGCR